MSAKTKIAVALIVAIAGIIGGGAAYTFDFSTNTDIDNSETNVSGDTVFNTFLDPDEVIEAGLDILCNMTNIPEGYEEACAER